MPYLSKLSLNPLRSGTQRLLRSPQAMHAAILGGIARQPVTERVLWRREVRPHVCEVLVLTQSMPSWESIIEQSGWPGSPDGAPLTRDYAPVLDRLAVGREFQFRVTANPSSMTRGVVQGPTASQRRKLDSSRSVRLGQRTLTSQLDWFLDRAAGDADRWGFSTGARDEAQVSVVERRRESFSKVMGTPRVSLDVATYEGRLRVTDTARLTSVLLGGLGRAKAYGCGLLTLAPPR